MSSLYPAQKEPYESGFFRVSDLHELYYQRFGNPEGKPVVALHGGPGAGCSPFYHQYFDPEFYNILLVDQRGAGKSKPHACLEENTTWDLVEDLEKLRNHFGYEKWLVFGGSWGACLALAYAETHPEKVVGLVLRGIFTLRRSELLWFYQSGCSDIFPEAWDDYLAPIPQVERGDMISAYHRRLVGDDPEVQERAAKAWTKWELSTARLEPDAELIKGAEDDQFSLAFARIETHFFVNGGFMETDDQLINQAGKLKNIPGTVAQGRYDVVCPPRTAWDLKKAWPEVDLRFAPVAGHNIKEEQIVEILVDATNRYRKLAW